MIHANCMNVPIEIHGWYAFKKLKESINDYLNLFPILYKLASKVFLSHLLLTYHLRMI